VIENQTPEPQMPTSGQVSVGGRRANNAQQLLCQALGSPRPSANSVWQNQRGNEFSAKPTRRADRSHRRLNNRIFEFEPLSESR
jgi:hypothetical protein